MHTHARTQPTCFSFFLPHMVHHLHRKKDANDIPADKTREDGDMVLLDEVCVPVTATHRSAIRAVFRLGPTCSHGFLDACTGGRVSVPR
jgi:hypothetical protein